MKNYLKPLRNLSFCISVVTVTFSANGQEIIKQGFDNGLKLTEGWVCTVKDTTSTAISSGQNIPALKFTTSSQFIETPEFSGANCLSFWTKGASIDSISIFIVKYFNGSAWSVLDSIKKISNSEKTYNYLLPSSAKKLRFVYYKSKGNIYLDDIIISKIPDPPSIVQSKVRITELCDYTARISVATNGPGKLYYLVTHESCLLPTIVEVIDTSIYEKKNIIDAGVLDIKDTSVCLAYLSGLQPATKYIVSFTTVNALNMASTIKTTLSFSTLKKKDDLFFSEIVRGSGNNKAIEIYNPGNDSVLIDNYRIAISTNGAGWKSYYYFTKNAKIPPKQVYVLLRTNADSTLIDFSKANESTNSTVLSFTGNDARGIQRSADNGNTWFFIDIFGDPTAINSFEIAGVSLAAEKYNCIRKSFVITGNTNWTTSSGTDSLKSEWLLLPLNVYSNIGLHHIDDIKPIISKDTNTNKISTESISTQIDKITEVDVVEPVVKQDSTTNKPIIENITAPKEDATMHEINATNIETDTETQILPEQDNLPMVNEVPNRLPNLKIQNIMFEGQIGNPITDTIKRNITVNIEDGVDATNISWECYIEPNIEVVPSPGSVTNFSKPVSFKLLSTLASDSAEWTIQLKTDQHKTWLKLENKGNIQIWPNPAKNNLFVKLDENSSTNYNILIRNWCGIVAQTNRMIDKNVVTLDISYLVNGIYFIEIHRNNGNAELYKFVKSDF
jgi:hypothetical protein